MNKLARLIDKKLKEKARADFPPSSSFWPKATRAKLMMTLYSIAYIHYFGRSFGRCLEETK